MQEFSGKVAVITGAASGIGMGLAQHCADEGMSPQECARIIFEGIRREQFWIFTHEDFKDAYRVRADSVLESTNPAYEAFVTNK
ncbi:MAG: hypothetical protein V7754_14240 [Halioglobus sp.]